MANSVPHPSLCAICLRHLLRLRLGALAGQALAYGWVHTQLGIILPIGPLVIIGLGLLGYSLWLLRRSHTPSGTRSCSLAREAVIDLASLAVSLYLTGGSHNPLIILLLLPVIVAAATLQPRLIWLVSSLAAAAYTVLMVFHRPFPVPHAHHDPSGFDLHVQGMWYAFLLSVVLIAYFVAQLGANLRDRDQELAQVREEALVENTPTGILMMRQGRLSLVNPRLARTPGQLPRRLTRDRGPDPDPSRGPGAGGPRPPGDWPQPRPGDRMPAAHPVRSPALGSPTARPHPKPRRDPDPGHPPGPHRTQAAGRGTARPLGPLVAGPGGGAPARGARPPRWPLPDPDRRPPEPGGLAAQTTCHRTPVLHAAPGAVGADPARSGRRAKAHRHRPAPRHAG